MVPSVDAMALRRLGASEQSFKALIKTLEQMKYRVQTALGISDDSYSNLQDSVFGTLQGSGASASMLIVSERGYHVFYLWPLLNGRSSGTTLTNPRKNRRQQRPAETSVNNMELILSMEHCELQKQ